MVWTKVKVKRQHDYPGVSFKDSGFYFNAPFIIKYNLESYGNIEFHSNSDDPYSFGFSFHKKATAASWKLQNSGRDKNTKGRTFKGSELRNQFKVIEKECQIGGDPFPIEYDEFNKLYITLLRPNFSIGLPLEEARKLPSHVKGIYRYLNTNGEVIYIGKGSISDRIKSTERKDWEIHRVEYSALEDDDMSFEWEAYYISQYVEDFGSKPLFNKIGGKSSGLKEN